MSRVPEGCFIVTRSHSIQMHGERIGFYPLSVSAPTGQHFPLSKLEVPVVLKAEPRVC